MLILEVYWPLFFLLNFTESKRYPLSLLSACSLYLLFLLFPVFRIVRWIGLKVLILSAKRIMMTKVILFGEDVPHFRNGWLLVQECICWFLFRIVFAGFSILECVR